jgi:Flp pilus assembly protein TadD
VSFSLGDLPRALQHFRRAVELDPRDVRACNNLGTALERLGEYTQAEEAYQRAVLADPAYPLTQRNLGLLQARRLGNPEAARRAWQRYLELAPTGAYADEVRRELAAAPGAPPQPAFDTAPPPPPSP